MPLPILLMTRPEAQSRAFAEALGRDGEDFRLLVSPLIGISFCGSLPDMAPFAGLVFTSANGVAAYRELGGPKRPCFTVGDATARAARAAGFEATSAEGTVEDLIALLKARRPAAPLLHVRGRHSRGDLAGRLSADGLPVRALVAYDQPAQPPSAAARAALAGRQTVLAPVFSPRSAALFSQLSVQAPLVVAAMSEAVAKALLPLHKQDLKTAARPDSDAMRELVAGLLRQLRTGER